MSSALPVFSSEDVQTHICNCANSNLQLPVTGAVANWENGNGALWSLEQQQQQDLGNASISQV